MTQIQSNADISEIVFSSTEVLYAYMDRDFNFIRVNPAYANADGRDPEFFVGKNHFDLFPYKDNEEIFRRVVETGEPHNAEAKAFEYIEHPERGISYLDWTLRPVRDAAGQVEAVVLCLLDATERVQTEKLMHVQRDLAVKLTATRSLEEGLKICLHAAMESSGMECGAVYLADEGTGSVEMVVHEGLSPEFVKIATHYGPETVNTRIIMEGEPVYMPYRDIGIPLGGTERAESVKAVAAVPFKCEGRVIGCLNLASRKIDETPMHARVVLESISAQIGGAVTRLRAEEAERAREELYRGTVDTSPDAIAVSDLGGRIIKVNRRVVELMGFENPEEIVGKSGYDLVAEEEREEFKERVMEGYRKGKRPTIEFTYHMKNGERRTGEFRFAVIKDESGNPRNVVTTVRDVTERKRASDLMRIQRDLALELTGTRELDKGLSICLDAALEASGMDGGGIYLFDGESGSLKLVYQGGLSTDFTESVSCYAPDSPNVQIIMKGKPVYTTHRSLGVPLDETKLAENLRAIAVIPILDEGRVIGCMNITSHTTDEVPLYARTALEAIAAQIGGAVAHLNAEKALWESEELYRTLVETSPDAILLMDMSGKLVWANQQAAENIGYKEPEELIGKSRAEFILSGDMDRAEDRMERALKSQKLEPAEYTITRNDGTSFVVESRNALVADSRGRPKLMMAVARDITERKRMEEALRESEERFRSLFEYAPDGYYLNDIEGNLIDGNKAAEEITGFKKKELIGKNFLQLGLLSEEDLPKAADLLARNVAGLPTGPDEFVLNRKDGSQVSVEIVTLPVALGGDKIVLGIARDVSARMKAERALGESEKRYRTLAENVNDVIWMMDMNLKMTYVSPSVERNSGYTPDEFMAKDLRGLMTPASFEVVLNVFREEVEKEAGEDKDLTRSRTMELEMVAKDGTTAWTEGSVTFMRDKDGRAIGVLGVSRDIEERRKAEEELRESEEKFRSFVESFHGIAFRGQIYAKPFFVKGAVEEMTGYTEEEIIAGEPGWEQLVIKEDLPKLVKDIDKIGSIPNYSTEREYRIVRKDGQVRWIHDRVQNSCNEEGKPAYVAGTLIDITDMKSAEEARRKAERDLEEQRALAIASDRLRSLGEMAAGIAHELNQPLVGVRGLAEHVVLALERKWELSKDDVSAKLRKIIEQADRMAYIIEHVRMFAREADKSEVRPVNVNEVVNTSLGLVSAQLRQRGLELEYRLADDVPEVEANPFSLEEVILNLVTNARDAVEERLESDSDTDTVVTLRTMVDHRGPETWVKVEVADRGAGITAEQLTRVFDPFYTTKEPDKGTGLGLAISRSIVEKLGGTIEIQSEPGGGTTAIISLPTVPR